MSVTTPKFDRKTLDTAPRSYFRAVDAKDVDEILAHFAEDATLTVQTDHVTFTGADEIRRMFEDFTGSWTSITHEITNAVVDDENGKAATELRAILRNETDGASADMYNCDFFDFNEEGKFARVIIWMDGTNPLT